MKEAHRDNLRSSSSVDELERAVADLLDDLRAKKADSARIDRFLKLAASVASSQELLRFKAEAERERAEYQLLQEVSLRLSSAADIRDVLRAILESLGQVVKYDAAGIFVFNKDLGIIEVDMLSGYQRSPAQSCSSKFQEGVKHGEGIVATVVFSGKPLYVPDVRKDHRYVEVRPATLSELAVPIFVRDELIGAFNLESDVVDAFSERDLRTLLTFASHAGVALERARNDRERHHTRRIEEELSPPAEYTPDSSPSPCPSLRPTTWAA
ncbi:MAG: GAF domain-containing protein [bacterium]|nr:GAF domain-containing protein [bacterium]